MSPIVLLTALLALAAGLAVGVLLGERWATRTVGSAHDIALDSAAQTLARTAESVIGPVEAGLRQLAGRVEQLQHDGVRWEARLTQQVDDVRRGGEQLRAETASLVGALRRPQVRGRWGELQLRRSLEIAGLTRHCAFDEQVPTGGTATPGPADSTGSEAGLRPDVVVTLPGERCVVIDSKVPLDAFLSAQEAATDDEREGHLRRHAAQVRRHMEQLAAKQYWRRVGRSATFVVMFVPAESLFAQALDTDPALLDDAATRRVMIATPTTLIAMLRTIEASWAQQSVAANAAEIHAVATELYERLCVAGRHLDRVGRSLTGAVRSYNELVGSLETRVFVTARRLHELDVGSAEPPTAEPGVDGVRPLAAAELTADAAGEQPVVAGAPGRETWTGSGDRRGSAAHRAGGTSLDEPERARRRS